MKPNRCFLVVLASLLGCDSPLGVTVEPAALMVTDSAAYTVDRGLQSFAVAIRYVYSNRTGDAVLLSNCSGYTGPSLEKLIDGSWAPAWSPMEQLCASAPIEIAEGTQYHDKLCIVAFDAESTANPKFLAGPVDGAYRLVWHRARWRSKGSGESMPIALRGSNTFRLIEP
jgi:hypothetical protein